MPQPWIYSLHSLFQIILQNLSHTSSKSLLTQAAASSLIQVTPFQVLVNAAMAMA